MDANRAQLVPIVDDIGLGESPRWRHDRVWYCDWVDGTVISVTPDGGDRIVHAQLDGFTVCIDWDADGRLLVVHGAQRQVLRDGAHGLELLADLAAVSDAPWNEIATHPSGRVYVNGVGFDMIAGDAATTGQIAVIDADGSVRQVAGDPAFPNGIAIIEKIKADRGCSSCTLSPHGELFITANVWDEHTFTTRRGVLCRAHPPDTPTSAPPGPGTDEEGAT